MKIVVIGGGPSGLMAAGSAIGAKVILLEKNEKLGKKLYITGKGRCNVSNNLPPKEFLENVVNNSKFLYGALNTFTPENTIELLRENGIGTKIERGNRVFPESDRASDVTKALASYAAKNMVDMRLDTNVEAITNDGDNFIVITDKGKIVCDKVILATGGKSYPSTGSTGDGYKFSKSLGHTIISPRPALVAIELKENVSSLMGLSLKNVEISFKSGKSVMNLFGEMLFTNSGISGPIVLSLSSMINLLHYQGESIFIDLKPALTEEVLDARVLSDFGLYANKQLKNALFDLLPRSLIPFIISYCNLDADEYVNTISKAKRQLLVKALKNLAFTIKELAPLEGAIVTAGGVCVKEISPKTMESKIISGLYFCGEMIDVDAFTGGFNIQIALSTGYIAGKYAAEVT